MSCYIGIDQSYSGMAVVVYRTDGPAPQEFLANYPPKKYGPGIDRLNAISSDLISFFHGLHWKRLTVLHICMEGYAPEKRFGREQAGELGSIVKQAVRVAFDSPTCYPTIVPPKNLKKFVTGSGNAPKDLMLLSVFKKWGQEYRDNNLADAYGLARMAEAVDTGITAFKYEQEALGSLMPHTEQWPLKAA